MWWKLTTSGMYTDGTLLTDGGADPFLCPALLWCVLLGNHVGMTKLILVTADVDIACCYWMVDVH